VAEEYQKIKNEPRDPTFAGLRRLRGQARRPGYVPERIKPGTMKRNAEDMEVMKMDNNEFAKSIGDLPVGWQNYLIKTRGVPSGMSGNQPPGPSPRSGLEWGPQTHRWLRPEQARQEQAKPTGVTQTSAKPFDEDAARETLQHSFYSKVMSKLKPELKRLKIPLEEETINHGIEGMFSDLEDEIRGKPKDSVDEKKFAVDQTAHEKKHGTAIKALNDVAEAKRKEWSRIHKVVYPKGPGSEAIQGGKYTEADVDNARNESLNADRAIHKYEDKNLSPQARRFIGRYPGSKMPSLTQEHFDKLKGKLDSNIDSAVDEIIDDLGDVQRGEARKSFDYDTIRKAVELVKRRL